MEVKKINQSKLVQIDVICSDLKDIRNTLIGASVVMTINQVAFIKLGKSIGKGIIASSKWSKKK